MKKLLPPISQNKIIDFQEAVLAWYQREGRSLPWRQTTDPYCIMVSEIMLQQTQVLRVIPKYEAWLEKFPNVGSLANATGAEILGLWSGLGYNRRALNLRKAAQVIVDLGRFPDTVSELIKLPGVGPYTSAAICSFAYNQDVPLVDTNLKRIYQLLVFGDGVEPTSTQLTEIATLFLPSNRSRHWHNALMDLGSLLTQENGAKLQQEKLVESFPILSTWKLPPVSDKPLKRPRQSTFKTSKRYWRGRILKLLNTHSSLRFNELKEKVEEKESSPYDIEMIVNELVAEGLAARNKNKVTLPT